MRVAKPTSHASGFDVVARKMEEFMDRVMDQQYHVEWWFNLLEKLGEVFRQMQAPRPWAAISEFQAKSDHWGE